MTSSIKVVWGLSVIVSAGAAVAGAARLAEGDPAGAADDAGASLAAENAVIDRAVEETPLERYTEDAAELVVALRSLMQRGLEEVKAARDEKDAVRLTCVNEPVATMKGVLRVGEDANASLLEALSLQNAAEARREFRKLKTSQRRMAALLRDAQSCVGALSSESTSAIELSVDESLVGSDPYYGNPNFFFDPQNAVAEGETNKLGQNDDLTVRPPPASGVS